MWATTQHPGSLAGAAMMADEVTQDSDPHPDRTPNDRRRSEFEEHLTPLLGRAYRAALSLTGSDADAQDLVQEAALNAFRRFETFAPGSNFKAWFLRILTNAFYLRVRRERRLANVLNRAAATHASSPFGPDDTPDNPATVFTRQLAIDQVMEAIRTLPPEYRTVATLYFVDDLPYHEIASILDCPLGTVRSRLHRSRRLLRRALRRVAQDHGVI